MEGGKSNRGRAVAEPEEQSNAKRQSVTMGLDTLDCPVCSQPLMPPIFQCPKGNFICSACRDKLLERERPASRRCYGVERIVDNTFVPCKHGCLARITYYHIQEHEERRCPFRPYFCPVSGCGFAGATTPLLDHLTTHHKLPTKTFKYFVPFEHRVEPGSLVLRGGYNRLLLLQVASLESLGHSVSLVCAGREASVGTTTCSMGFSCFEGHYQVSTLSVGSSALPDGLPTQCLCVVPKVSGGHTDVVLWITINLLYDHYEELEEEDSNDDGSYNPDEDDNMTTKLRMVITEQLAKEEDDDNIDEEEDDDNVYEEEDDDTITTSRTWWVMSMTNVEDGKDDGADDHNGD